MHPVCSYEFEDLFHFEFSSLYMLNFGFTLQSWQLNTTVYRASTTQQRFVCTCCTNSQLAKCALGPLIMVSTLYTCYWCRDCSIENF